MAAKTNAWIDYHRKKNNIALPKIVSIDEWQTTCKKLLAKEKKMTRAMDALAAERRPTSGGACTMNMKTKL